MSRLLARLWSMPGTPAAALLAGYVLVFFPALAYHYNEAFFIFPFVQLLAVLLPLAAGAFLLLTGLAAIGGQRTREVSAAALTGLAAACWAGATFLISFEGQLDGRTGLRFAGVETQVAGTVLWFAIVAVVATLAWRFAASARKLVLAGFAVLAAHTAYIAAVDDNRWQGPPAGGRLVTLSTERNVLVVLLDAFQSDFVDEALRHDPRALDAFEGFVRFPNAVGSAITTYLAMPTIHSGASPAQGRGIRALYRKEVVEGSFVSSLADAGYDAMVVNPMLGFCPRRSHCDHIAPLVHGRTLPLMESVTFLLNTSAVRVMPPALKPWMYRDGKWRWMPLRMFIDFAKTSNDLLDLLAARVRPGSPVPTVRFVHLMSTHGPASLDARCGPVDREWTRPWAIEQSRCALTKVAALLRSLSQKGLYDSTLIVVLADHGSGLAAEAAGGFELGAAASPLLMVKPFRARGAPTVSDRVVGLAGVAATICSQSGSCSAKAGSDVLGEQPPAARYTFVTYNWSASLMGADEVPFDNLFEVRGPPRLVGSWWRLSNLPSAVRQLRFSGDDNQQAYGFGWAGFELYDGKWMRWSVGSESDVYVELATDRDNEIEVEVMTHAGNLPQSMVIEVNGSKVGEVEVGASWSRQRVRVPAGAARKGGDRVLFRSRHANSPDPGDPRRLGLLFGALVVHPL